VAQMNKSVTKAAQVTTDPRLLGSYVQDMLKDLIAHIFMRNPLLVVDLTYVEKKEKAG
jgi:hypothetical protein